MEANKDLLFLRYGGAEKDTVDMTGEELEKLAAAILVKVKERAFFKGLPIIFGEGGKVYEEWQDGRIVECKS